MGTSPTKCCTGAHGRSKTNVVDDEEDDDDAEKSSEGISENENKSDHSHQRNKVALITGGNQGLGYALVKGLCKSLPFGSTIYMGVRNFERGRKAAAELMDMGLAAQPILCDVSDDRSVKSCAEFILEAEGSLDIVIHNAAARLHANMPKHEQVSTFVNTNNLGTSRMAKYFAPIMGVDSHFLIIASSFGALSRLNKSKHSYFDFKKQTIEDIDNVMIDYVEDVKARVDGDKGWPEWINVPSKVGQVVVAKILAQDVELNRRQVLVHAVCPGLIDTQLSRAWFKDVSKAATPDQAAVDVLWLVQNRYKDGHGELISKRRIVKWL